MTAVLYSAGVNVMRISTLPLAGTTPVKQPLQQKHTSINSVIFIHTHMYKHGTCTCTGTLYSVCVMYRPFIGSTVKAG